MTEKAKTMLPIDVLVGVNNKVVDLMNAIDAVQKAGGLNDSSTKNRVNMLEQVVSGVATALNVAVTVLKDQEAQIDALTERLKELEEPVNVEDHPAEADIPGDDA